MAPGILSLIPTGITSFCEPFVGGGGVVLALLSRTAVPIEVVLNDADQRVACWWEVLADTDPNDYLALLNLIDLMTPTVRSHDKALEIGLTPESTTRLLRAFTAIYLNRSSFSGILSAGPIGGAAQRSVYDVGCRWNAKTLRTQHEQVRQLLGRHQVKVFDQDFRSVLSSAPDAFVYADPPYVKEGARLYPSPFTRADHEALAVQLLSRDNWLLSYDDHPWVRERYAGCLIENTLTHYSISNRREEKIVGSELFIRPASAARIT